MTMMATYVLYIECDGDVPTVSVHASVAEAEAELRKVSAELLSAELLAGRDMPSDDILVDALVEHAHVVDCRIYVCSANNSDSDWISPFIEA
jgi:hypothetical protein